jgi:Fe2+ or Zn2+ uptake regulation protein
MCDTKTLFVRKGLRCTRQREEIFQTLALCRSHPTAEELYWMVRERRPELGLSLATVYNTLDAFCASTLCRKLPPTNGDAGARYDADLHEHLHLAMADGRLLDVPDDLGAELVACIPRTLLDTIAQRMGVEINSVRISLSAEAPPESRSEG